MSCSAMDDDEFSLVVSDRPDECDSKYGCFHICMSFLQYLPFFRITSEVLKRKTTRISGPGKFMTQGRPQKNNLYSSIPKD